MPMCGEAILQICAHSNRKHCRVAQIPMAASWCRRKSNTRSASGCSTFRRSARSPAVRDISSNIYKKPMMTTGPAAGWVGETDARTQTDSPTLDELSFPAMELYAMPAATAMLLEDARSTSTSGSPQEVERRVRRPGRRGLRHRRRQQQAERLRVVHHRGERLVDLGQHRLRRVRRGGRFPVEQAVRCAGRSGLSRSRPDIGRTARS